MKKGSFLWIFLSVLLLSACGNGDDQTMQQESKEYPNVEENNSAAAKLYDEGDFRQSLDLYLNSMEQNPRDIDAFLGTIRCQIAMENYDVAEEDLRILADIDPMMDEIYDLYFEIGERTDNIYYNQQAVRLAKQYNKESIVQEVPAEPVFSVKEGAYDERIELEITSPDAEAEIYYRYYNQTYGSSVSWSLYQEPIEIYAGDTEVYAYAIKDKIPSESVSGSYQLEYEGTKISFADPVMELMVRKALDKEEGEITDLDCLGVRRISIYDVDYEYRRDGGGVKTLEDLKYLPFIYGLTLSDQKEIEDFTPIAFCSQIEDLDLRYTGIQSLDFMKGAEWLTYLYISGTDVKSLKPVSECKRLYYLDISNCDISDLEESLESMDKLNALEMDSYSLSDYSILKKRPGLVRLTLYGFDGIDREGLKQLDQLKTLSFNTPRDMDWQNPVYLEDISFLESMTQLESLTLNYLKDEEQLKYLYGLQNLKTLYLYGNSKITENTSAMEALRQALPGCEIRN